MRSDNSKFILFLHPNRIPPNLKSTIYCITLREGGVQEWNFAYKQLQDTTSASEKEIILSALGCTQKPWLLTKYELEPSSNLPTTTCATEIYFRRYLNLTITPNSPIRKQDGARAFASVARNIVGSEIAFDFLYTNIGQIAE